MNVVEVEIFGIPDATLEKLRSLPFVDALSVEDPDQKQMLLIQTDRGAEAVPDILGTIGGSASGGSWSVSRPWRMLMSAWWVAAHEHQNPDPVLADHPGRRRDDHAPAADGWLHPLQSFQPIMIAVLGLFMLQDKGPDRGHVRCGGQRADGVMVQPAIHLGQQHQLRALVRYSGGAGRHPNAL